MHAMLSDRIKYVLRQSFGGRSNRGLGGHTGRRGEIGQGGGGDSCDDDVILSEGAPGWKSGISATGVLTRQRRTINALRSSAKLLFALR